MPSLYLAFYGTFMECSWGVQPVLGVFAILETNKRINIHDKMLCSASSS